MEAIQEHIQQLESQAKSIRGKAALLTSKQDKRARQSLYKLADQTKRAAIRYRAKLKEQVIHEVWLHANSGASFEDWFNGHRVSWSQSLTGRINLSISCVGERSVALKEALLINTQCLRPVLISLRSESINLNYEDVSPASGVA